MQSLFTKFIKKVVLGLGTTRAGVLNWGYLYPFGVRSTKAGGYEMRRQNNGYFKLFAKNLFSMLFEIRKHFPKPFLTTTFLNNFLSKERVTVT